MLDEIFGGINAPAAQFLQCRIEIARIPQRDRGDEKIEARGPVELVLEAPVANFAEPVEEDSTSERIAGLALVQPGVGAVEAKRQVAALVLMTLDEVAKGGKGDIFMPELGRAFSHQNSTDSQF